MCPRRCHSPIGADLLKSDSLKSADDCRNSRSVIFTRTLYIRSDYLSIGLNVKRVCPRRPAEID